MRNLLSKALLSSGYSKCSELYDDTQGRRQPEMNGKGKINKKSQAYFFKRTYQKYAIKFLLKIKDCIL